MKLDRAIRFAIALLIAVVFIVAIGALLFLTEAALNVWDRLAEGPRVLLFGYVAVMTALVALAVYLVVKLVVRRPAKSRSAGAKPRTLTREAIEKRLRDAEAAGVEVSAARAELGELARRAGAGAVSLCFFGEISSGKSSLVRALVPDADVEVDVVGGSTTTVRHFRWRDEGGTEILLTDVPGTGGEGGALDTIATEEAKRAHVVLFVCDGDLTRAESEGIRRLLDLEKPLILVMNKADRYDAAEQAVLLERLLERLEEMGGQIRRDRVVAVSAGGEREVRTRRADGSEALATRKRPADIGVLVVAVNRLLERDAGDLDERRDRAVFSLAADKLEAAEAVYREQRAEQVIRAGTRRAVIGALAAVSPGTDILIQGYIGTMMTQELCKLYGAAPRDLDVEEFLSLSQSRVGRALPLSLAVAGNGLKAFPGVGTVAGGLVHAVAYGLIFDALGRSLKLTLARHGELVPEDAAREFEEGVSEYLEKGVRRVASMALEEKSRRT